MKAKSDKINKVSSAKPTSPMHGSIDELILKDHRPIKKLIKVMTGDHMKERQEAFEEFVSLLVGHAQAEEKALYTYLQAQEEFRAIGFEGMVEHKLATQLIEEVNHETDENLKTAKIKVLAELVEHHIKEEETEMLPDLKKHVVLDLRKEIGQKYLELKKDFEANVFTNTGSNQIFREQNAIM